jgi:hypothetical protein
MLDKAAFFLWKKNGHATMRNMIGYDPKEITVIHGCATGADTIGGECAKMRGCNVLEFPAPWGDVEGKPDYQIGTRADGSKYWKAAGPYRNRQMLAEGRPDIILAFHSDIANSKGTLDMIKASNKAGLEVRLYAG